MSKMKLCTYSKYNFCALKGFCAMSIYNFEGYSFDISVSRRFVQKEFFNFFEAFCTFQQFIELLWMYYRCT